MTRRRSRPAGRAPAALLGVLLAACGAFEPAPTPPPAPTPRPAPADVEPWPALAWQTPELGSRPAERATALAGVVAGPGGVVAVGHVDLDGGTDGIVAHAPDGAAFERIDDPDLRALWLLDVAADRRGYVAIGDVTDAQPTHPTVGIVVSPDGRAWERLALGPAFADAYATGIARGPGAFLAWGWDHGDDLGADRLWRSVDGRVWTAISAAELGLPGVEISSLGGTDAGWTATGVADRRPVVATSADGLHWQVETLPPSGRRQVKGTRADRLVVGEWGRLAVGSEGQDCDFLWIEGDCAGWSIAWWSDGSGAWSPIEAPFRPVGGGGVAIAPGRGFIEIGGRAAASSVDGLTWSPLPGPAADALVVDVIVDGDRIVAVGDRSLPNGSQAGWIGVGGPEDLVGQP